MVDILAAPRQAKTDTSLRTLIAISTAHWVSHFHLFVLPMLFPFLKEQLGVGYIELGFALTVFAVVSGLTQAPMGYLGDRIGARKILLMGLALGGLALIMLGLIASEATVGWYGAASRVVEAFNFVPLMLTMAVFPVASRLWVSAPAEFQATVRKTLRLVLAARDPIAAPSLRAGADIFAHVVLVRAASGGAET